MILNDLEDLKQNNYVVIIGSGPAGISVALQLEKKGISSVILRLEILILKKNLNLL